MIQLGKTEMAKPLRTAQEWQAEADRINSKAEPDSTLRVKVVPVTIYKLVPVHRDNAEEFDQLNNEQKTQYLQALTNGQSAVGCWQLAKKGN